MTPAEKAQLDEHVQAIAKLLYADADKSKMALQIYGMRV